MRRFIRISFCFFFCLMFIFFSFVSPKEDEIPEKGEEAVADQSLPPETTILYDKESMWQIPGEKRISVPTISQYPLLPTGCESVAATMVLQYYGENISAKIFARRFLKSSMKFQVKGGVLYGPDPNQVFVGDPFDKNSYGCFADPIVNAVNSYGENLEAIKITDKTLDQLCEEYIVREEPLLIWATMGMKASKKGNSWRLENGTEFTWTAGEHCLVLTGYDANSYFLNDPMTGTVVSYPKDVVQKRFEELGSQAVLILRKK